MPKLTGFSSVPLPGPPPFPLLGYLPRVFQFLDDPIATLTALRRHGDVVAVARNSPAIVCVFGAERNREVLSNPSVFRHDEDAVKGPRGSSLARMSQIIVCINGELHKRHRRLLAPAFAKAALDGYADEIVRVAEGVVARWPMGQVVDLDACLRDLAMYMAVRTLFGLDVLGGATELGEVSAAMLENLSSPLSILVPYDLPGTPFRRTLRLGDRLLDGLEALVVEKRRRTEVESDALALLLRAVDDDGTRFTDAELVAETAMLFVAGHETTAKTLTWTMFLLERHPEVLADVLDEIDGVLGGRSMTAADIARMPLLDRVIKETMRLLTPLPMLFLRVPAAEVTLGGHTLPKHANVVVSPYVTHRDPALYSEPLRFRPERWAEQRPTTYEYLPFGAGPRICLGAAFAQQALRLLLPTVLQRVRVAIVRDANIARTVRGNVLRPKHGIRAQLQPPHRRRLVPEPIRGNILEMVELR